MKASALRNLEYKFRIHIYPFRGMDSMLFKFLGLFFKKEDLLT